MTKRTRGEQSDLNLDLTLAVGAAHRALTTALLRKLVERGFSDLSPAYAAILPFIEPDGARQVDVAHRAGLSKQAVGQLVRELGARGYVDLVADGRDRRARVIRFTPRGLALRLAGLEIKREFLFVATRSIGSKAAGRLTQDLGSLVEALAALDADDVR